jgi:uncharacterized protein YuzE
MIQTNYDPEADVLHVRFGAEGAQYDGSTEVAPGVFVEFGAAGRPIGVEIISVRKRADAARSLQRAARRKAARGRASLS